MATSNIDSDANLNQEVSEDDLKLMDAPLADDPSAATPAPSPAPAADDHDEDEPDGDATGKNDAELDEAADEAAREAIRERRRIERKAKKDRSRERVDQLERTNKALQDQIQALSQQVGSIQSHTTGTQLARLDQEIENAGKAVGHFKALIADAGTKGDGQTIADATEAMLEARDRQRQLTQIKERVTKQSTAAPAVDPLVVRHASAFIQKNSWYNPAGNDRDTQIMRIVDNEVAAAGFDMRTPEYYEELEKRGRMVLPHRFNAGSPPAAPTPPAAPRRQPVAGAGGEGGGTRGGGGNFELSAERVKAMKESGAWDDPKRRQKMINDYREYDKAQGARS